MARETTPAIHWREGPQQGAPFHAYVRSSKGSMLGMNFDSLCGQYWISTVKFGKPNAYPPAEVDRCVDCRIALARLGERRKEKR